MLKLLVEFGPILVFFATYKYADIFKATLYMVVVTIVSLIVSYLIDRKISIPLMISGIVLLISGSITLLSGDPDYIKMKPTIVYIIFGSILYIGYMMKNPLIKAVLGSAFSMNDTNWMILSRRFAFYFYTMAIINEIIWRNFSESFWVNFKVFGAVPITLLFIFTQAPFLMRNKQDNSPL
ncbi:MAG UNVERIFIED_CONTAM: septation protein A [Rickettsiaceae bacterium]|jgi:intracellular septation protein